MQHLGNLDNTLKLGIYYILLGRLKDVINHLLFNCITFLELENL